jgi:hypothetical protein
MRTTILALAALCSLVPAASATTIDTFSLTQGGYQDGGVLTGSFSGNVEANGFIELSDLKSINLTFTYTPGSVTATLFGYGPATFFSYATNGGSSSLDFVSSIGAYSEACVGAVAAFGAFGCGNGVANAAGSVSDFTTTQLASVSLTASVTTPPPPAQPSPVPEPASLLLVSTALLGAGAGEWKRHQRAGLAIRA